MDENQELLAELLCSAIHPNLPKVQMNRVVPWLELYNEAQKHDVYTYLYPIVNTFDSFHFPDSKLPEKWRRATLVAGIQQTQHMVEISHVLLKLRHANIPVIVLKGIALRNLYPNPALRTMLDADFLISSEYLQASILLLKDLGYFLQTSDAFCYHFAHKYHLPIELHLSLYHFESPEILEYLHKDIWKNKLPLSVNAVDAFTLSVDEHAVYLCYHMSKHFKAYGFGIRQICDFVLFIEAGRDSLHWDSFTTKIELLGIKLFVQCLFLVCKKLLSLELPPAFFNQDLENDPNIALFIHDIFDSGLHGHSSTPRHISSRILGTATDMDMDIKPKKLSYFITYAFPPVKKLGPRYSYAIRFPVLYPIAWLHRFGFNLFYNNLAGVIKDTLTASSSSTAILEQRLKLIQWFGFKS